MVSGTQLLELILNGLTIGMVYVLVAAGLSIVFGVMDVLNISHGELLALGAYFAFSLISSMGGNGFWVALVVVPIGVALLGVVIERFTIRRVYGRGHLAHVLLTFGLLLIIYDLKQILWGTEAKLFSAPAVIDHPVQILGFSYSLYNYFMILSAAGLALATWALLNYTKFGLVVRAGSEDRGMVRNLGIDIDRYYTLVFGFGAALAAFGGVVLGGYQNVNLEMGNAVIIPAFVIVVLGGLGSFRGAVVGGLGVGIIQSVLSTYVPQLQGLVIFLIMIGVLLVRPHGLFGSGTSHVAGRSEPSEFVSGLEGGLIGDRFRSRLGLALLGLLVLVPVFEGILYTPFVVTLAIEVLIWALFALSIDIILGYAGLISLGHALFYGVGAYTVMLVFLHLTPSVFVALGIALLLCAMLAWVVGYLSLRVSGVYFVMITLAFAELFYSAVFKFDFTGGSNGLFGGPTPLYGIAGVGIHLNDIVVGVEPFAFYGDELFYYFLLAVVVGVYLTTRRIMEAPFGSILQSIRESEQRAKFIGYDVQGFKRRAFVLSGTLGGLAGALFAVHYGYAAPALLHWINSGDVIIMAVLGGTGTLYGPMIGASVFIVFEEQLSSLIPWWRLLLGVFFVLVVLFLPKGIISFPAKLDELVNGEGTDIALGDEAEADN
ncbi:ABC transporter permease [Haloarchaeobius sp. HRN-SO-5]|uniref:ABC transporter permease n=1 Tax=Haloarchaeobius sp. HRN-SO-5 TaxID=3446118 RepID=UPI003EBF91B0